MGLYYRERLKQRVNCLECGVGLVAGLLMDHCQLQNGVGCDKATPPPPPRGVRGGWRMEIYGRDHITV